MALARYTDLTIDAQDPPSMAAFWSCALGLEAISHGIEGCELVGADPTDTVWIRPLLQPRTARRRVHLDVYAEDPQRLVAAGGTMVDQDSYPWDVMTDPEGREVGVVQRPGPHRSMYQIVFDSPEPEANASWWGRVLDAKVHLVPDDPSVAFIEPVPGAPFESLVFAREPGPKTVFNSMRLNVTAQNPDVLLLLGATMCEEPHPLAPRTYMRDPHGNEFTWVAP